MDRLMYNLWLSLAVGSRRGVLLLHHFNSTENVYAASENMFRGINGITSEDIKKLSNKSVTQAETVLEVCKRESIDILDYENSLYPQLLCNIYDFPIVLYIRGKLPPQTAPYIAIVGTRDMTPYGKVVASRLSESLSRCGYVVVSGMATGIDSEAHIGALKADGKTVAVLGCGVDVVYPKENRELMKYIASSGAVISEYPPGTKPKSANFPERNRIMSGLCLGTVVVEAGRRSGALISASCALEQGRDVFAIPGSIANPKSEGTNSLLKDGAKPVTCVKDILEEYEFQFPYDDKIENPDRLLTADSTFSKAVNYKKMSQTVYEEIDIHSRKEKPAPKLTQSESAVYSVVSRGIEELDAIINESGLKAQEATAVLTMLEIGGHVTSLPGKRYKLK